MDTSLHTSLLALPDQSRLVVKYSGDALANGVMDLQDLAPALDALRRVIVRSAETLNHEDTDPHVFISAETRAGSFEFIVIAAQATVATLLANAEHIKSSFEVVKTVFGEGGVVELLKMIRAKKGNEVHEEPLDDGRVAVTVTGNNNRIVVLSDALILSKQDSVRDALWETVAPLVKTGIDRVTFDPADDHTEITSEEAVFFRVPSVVLVNEDHFSKDPVTVTVIKPAFAEHKRWRLQLGDQIFGALMEDKAFQSKVLHREILFGTGDRLRVDLVKRTHKKKETDYFIERVYEVIRPPEQLGL